MRGLRIFIALILLFLAISNLYAGEYVAFSLKVAQERVIKAKGKVPDEVFNLAGITAIRGLVYDRETGDAILVGEKDPNRAPLTLDDFVVALRARFIHGKWPLVSIDPTPETKKTNMQIVRFEGGIEDTQFGKDLFDADYSLKRIAMGLLPSGIPGLKTYWDLSMEEAKTGTYINSNISSRFWFYPVLPSVSVREDVVAIKGLKVGVFTEVLSAEIDGKKIEDLKTFQDVAGDKFARAVSQRYDELAKVHPSFLRLQGLTELVALTKAIEEMDEKPDLSYWLKDYPVKSVETKKEVEVLRRKEDYRIQEGGMVYSSYIELSGGVELMAIALRLKAGDVTALKEAVLKTRPKPDALSWSFIVAEWLIPTAPGQLQIEDVVPLFTQAVFLQEQKRYDDAILLYEKIIELKPDWNWPYYNRGIAYYKKDEYDRAISDYNKAIEINPGFAGAYINRGTVYADKDDYDRAISDYNKAIEINPGYYLAYYNRGNAYYKKGDYDRAISDFNKVIELNPGLAGAYNNRGAAYDHKGDYDRAISDFNKAIEINPGDAEAYNNRGNAYADKGDYDRAIFDYNKAIVLNPGYAKAYYNRGTVYALKGDYDRAIFDYNKAIELNPGDAKAYNNRGLAYHHKGEYDRAISDFNKAIELNPGYAGAYFNKGVACEKAGRIKEAISAYKAFIQYAPPQYAPYIQRAKERIRQLERQNLSTK